jgi:large subunit ribosomal protein L2
MVKLPSGKRLRLHKSYLVVLGKVSNPRHRKEVQAYAGPSLSYGVRPKVRGVARNPVDHPHGGSSGVSTPTVSP